MSHKKVNAVAIISAIVKTVLKKGEDTSEHAVMTSATNTGRIYATLGSIVALLPMLMDYLSTSPVAETRWGGIVVAVIGGIIAVLGIVKETKAKVEYINGRNLLKASTMNNLGALKSVEGVVEEDGEDIDLPKL